MIKTNKYQVFFIISLCFISLSTHSCQDQIEKPYEFQLRSKEDFIQFLREKNYAHLIEQSDIIAKIYAHDRTHLSYSEASLAVACAMVRYHRTQYPQFSNHRPSYTEYIQFNDYVSRLNAFLTHSVFIPQR